MSDSICEIGARGCPMHATVLFSNTLCCSFWIAMESICHHRPTTCPRWAISTCCPHLCFLKGLLGQVLRIAGVINNVMLVIFPKPLTKGGVDRDQIRRCMTEGILRISHPPKIHQGHVGQEKIGIANSYGKEGPTPSTPKMTFPWMREHFEKRKREDANQLEVEPEPKKVKVEESNLTEAGPEER